MNSSVGYDQRTCTLYPYGVEVLFGRDVEGRVVDILIPMTDSEYSNFLTHFEDKEQSWQRSSYVYIFQNQLAGYQHWFDENADHLDADDHATEVEIQGWMKVLRECSELYAPLESLINKRMGSSGELPGDVLHSLKELRKGLIEKLPEELRGNLIKELDAFIKEVEGVLNKLPRNARDVRNLFSLSREDRNKPCLGYFLSQQLFELGDIGKKQVNLITDKHSVRGKFYNRMKNQFRVPPAHDHLSDAKSQIERKRSAYGAEYNSNSAVIPIGMIETLTPQPDEKDAQNNSVKYYRSVKRYVSRCDDREEVDHLLRQVSNNGCDKHYVPRKYTLAESIGKGVAPFGVAVASLIEMFFPSAVRMAASVIVGAAGAIYPGGYIQKADEWLSKQHEAFSPVKAAKRWRDHYYVGDPEIDDLHRQLGVPNSFFKTQLDRYNSAAFARFIRGTVVSVFRTVFISPFVTLSTMFGHAWKKFTSPNYNEDLYLKYSKKANDKVVSEFRELLNSSETTPEQAPAPAPGNRGEYRKKDGVVDMQTPHIESFIHFMQSIVVVLSDELIDQMFRKSPGFATLSFMTSCASLGLMCAPHAAPAITAFSEGFAKATMGKEVGGISSSTALMNNMFTAVLQFKTIFVALELAKGDVKLLKEVFKNPEYAMLAFMVSSASGMLMGLLPAIPADMTTIRLQPLGINNELPNIYAEGVNLFIHEAQECLHHGQLGATSIEFSFLSIKMGFLVQSLSAGLHCPPRHADIILTEMIKAYKEIPDDQKPKTRAALAQHFHDFLQEKELSVADRGILITQLHHSLIYNAMFEAHKASTRSTMIPLVVTPDRILIDHGITDPNEQQKFINNFNQAKQYAKKQTAKSTQGLALPDQMAPVQHETKRDKLLRMFRFVRQLELSGIEIESSLEKNRIYDMLYMSVQEYNEECIANGNPGLQFDGKDYLDSFYNKHVYRGSNNFIRSLQLFLPPLPLFVVAWRLTQRAILKLYDLSGNPSPALKHKLDKSRAKDLFLLNQTIFMFGRLGQVAARAVTYGVIRVSIFAVPAIPLTVVTSPLILANLVATPVAALYGFAAGGFSFKAARAAVADVWNPDKNPITAGLKSLWEKPMSWAIDLGNAIRPYKEMKFPSIWRTAYSKQISTADTHSENLVEMSDKAIAQMERQEQEQVSKKPKPVLHSHQAKAATNGVFSSMKSWLSSEPPPEDIELKTEYQQVFSSLSRLVDDLTRRLNTLSVENQDKLKAEPAMKELKAAEGVLKLFHDKPPKDEIYIQSYLERLRVREANLHVAEKLISQYEVKSHKPSTKIS